MALGDRERHVYKPSLVQATFKADEPLAAVNRYIVTSYLKRHLFHIDNSSYEGHEIRMKSPTRFENM